MSVFQERVELNEAEDWGYFDALCLLPTHEYKEKRKAMVVLPGGGYAFVSEREAEPVALKFFAAGYNTFTLHYTVDPQKMHDPVSGEPKPLLEVSKAIALIRRNAEKYNIDPDKIAVVGFSAGGHLAGSIATLWNSTFLRERLGIAEGENKPNAAILSYPVLSADESIWHEGSFRNLLAGSDRPFDEEKWNYSLEKKVSENTCPCFLWHTSEDTCVPVENSLVFGLALKKAGRRFEMHIYPDGYHGLSTAEPEMLGGGNPAFAQHASAWVPAALSWLSYLFDR